MRMILVFIDGIGIGRNDLLNPFIEADIPNWHSFINNFSFFEADALVFPGFRRVLPDR